MSVSIEGGVDALFQSGLVLNADKLKPMMEWMVSTMQSYEKRLSAIDGGPASTKKQAEGEARPMTFLEMGAKMAKVEESLELRIEKEVVMEAKMMGLEEAGQNNEDVDAIAAAVHGLKGDVKKLRGDSQSSASHCQALQESVDELTAGMEKKATQVDLRKLESRVEETEEYMKKSDEGGLLKTLEFQVRALKEEHTSSMQQMKVLVADTTQLKTQSEVLVAEIAEVRYIAGPPPKVDLGNGERDILVETQCLVEQLDKRCHENEWQVRKLEQHVAQVRQIATATEEKFQPIKDTLHTKADVTALDKLAKKMSAPVQAPLAAPVVIGQGNTGLKGTQKGQKGDSSAFYEDTSGQGDLGADNGAGLEVIEAVNNLGAQVSAQAIMIKELTDSASCKADKADLEMAMSKAEEAVRHELSSTLHIMSNDIERMSTEQYLLSSRLDAQDSRIEEILSGEVAGSSQKEDAEKPEGLDALWLQVQAVERQVKGLKVPDSGSRGEQVSQLETTLSMLASRVAQVETLVTHSQPPQVVASESEPPTQTAPNGDVVVLKMNQEQLLTRVAEIEMHISDLSMQVATAAATSAADPAPSGTNSSEDDNSSQTAALSHGLNTMASLVKGNMEGLETLRRKVLQMGHTLNEVSKTNKETAESVEGKLDKSEARWFVPREEAEALMGRLEHCEGALLDKADKVALEALSSQKSVDVEHAPQLNMEEVFNDQERQIKSAVNANTAGLLKMGQELFKIQTSLSQKASSEQIEMMSRLTEHLKQKVAKVPNLVAGGESGLRAELSSLKLSVSSLFKEQKRTDQAQSRDLAHLETKLQEFQRVVDQVATQVKESGGVITHQLDTAPDPGDKLAPQATTSGLPAAYSGPAPQSQELPNTEGLVMEVAEAVHDIFSQRFRAIDTQLRQKADYSEIMQQINQLLQSTGASISSQKKGTTIGEEFNNDGFGVNGADIMVLSPDTHYVSNAMRPPEIPMNARKYARGTEKLSLPRLVPSPTKF